MPNARIMAIQIGIMWSTLFIFGPTPVIAADDAGLTAQLESIQAEIDAYEDDSRRFDAGVRRDDAASLTLPEISYMRGEIVSIEKDEQVDVGGVPARFRLLSVRLLGADEDAGATVLIEDNDLDDGGAPPLEVGERVAVVRSVESDGTASYFIADRYRVPALGWLVMAFFLVAAWFGRGRGVFSVAGLGFTVIALVYWVVPQIMAGAPAFPTILAAAAIVSVLSLYVAHGFRARTTISVIATLATLVIAVLVEHVAVFAARLYGNGSEEALFLQGIGDAPFDLRGLLLGGILLGALGVLDDITTAQVAVVEELKAADPKFRAAQLYRRGLSVGREHIASLTNTLFLAYAGASLPLFLLFSADRGQPFWFIANSALIAEEIVRTMVGSISLVLAVPISTWIAARWYDSRTVPHDEEVHGHGH